MKNKVVIFDFETGGIKPENPNIQLAAIAVDQEWNEVDSFERKIKFDESKCSPDALKINHYEPGAWKDASSGGGVVKAAVIVHIFGRVIVMEVEDAFDATMLAGVMGCNLAALVIEARDHAGEIIRRYEGGIERTEFRKELGLEVSP